MGRTLRKSFASKALFLNLCIWLQVVVTALVSWSSEVQRLLLLSATPTLRDPAVLLRLLRLLDPMSYQTVATSTGGSWPITDSCVSHTRLRHRKPATDSVRLTTAFRPSVLAAARPKMQRSFEQSSRARDLGLCKRWPARGNTMICRRSHWSSPIQLRSHAYATTLARA